MTSQAHTTLQGRAAPLKEESKVTTEPDLQVPGLAAQVGGGIQDDGRQHSERLSWRAGGHRAQVAQHHIVHVCAGDVSHDVDLNVAGVELCHDRISHALQGECLNLLGVGISESPVQPEVCALYKCTIAYSGESHCTPQRWRPESGARGHPGMMTRLGGAPCHSL